MQFRLWAIFGKKKSNIRIQFAYLRYGNSVETGLVAMELMQDSFLTVCIFSRSAIIREGLRVILEGSGWRVVGGSDLEVGKGASVIIVDLTSRRVSDAELQEIVSEYQGVARILCFDDAVSTGDSAIRSGLDTIYSFSTPEEVVSAVAGPRKAAARRAAFSSSLSVSLGSERRLVDTLSRREREVFRLLGRGLWNCRVAKELGISVKTVETHKENLKAKLKLQSTRELMKCAIECYRK